MASPIDTTSVSTLFIIDGSSELEYKIAFGDSFSGTGKLILHTRIEFTNLSIPQVHQRVI